MNIPEINLVMHPKLLSVSIKVQLNHFSSGKDQSLFFSGTNLNLSQGKLLVDLKYCKTRFPDWLLDLILINKIKWIIGII